MTDENDDEGIVYKIQGDEDSDSIPKNEDLENEFLLSIRCIDGNTYSLDRIGNRNINELHSLLDLCAHFEMIGYDNPIRFKIESVLNRYYSSKISEYPSPNKIWNSLKDDTPSGIILTMASIRKAVMELGNLKGYQGSGGFHDRLLYLYRKGFVNKHGFEDILLLYDMDIIARTKLSFRYPSTCKLMGWKKIYCNLVAQIFIID